MIKVSIIIPVYNVESYIEECLQSVIKQTMTEGLECIIVDDCGQDRSIEMVKRFINAYIGKINFKIAYRGQNGGLSAARNTGIETATGEYLYFLDSDDTIVPECMELMYGYVEKHGKVDLVQGSFYETNEEKATFSQYKIPEFTDNCKQIKSFLLRYEGDIVGAQSRLIRREFLLKNNLFFKQGIIHEDNYWTFFLAKHVSTMAFCPVRTYYHRYNPTSITGNVNREKEIIAYRTIIKDLSLNIDTFLSGCQKELILNNLITALKKHYYADEDAKKELVGYFYKSQNFLEKIFFSLFFKTNNSKLLHLLIRIYKIKD